MDKNHVNYRRDFALPIEFRDSFGQSATLPDYDFLLIARTNGRERYRAGVRGGTMINLRKSTVGYEMIFDAHELMPGTLKIAFSAEVPDNAYPDGYRTEYSETETDIRLVTAQDNGPLLTERVKIRLPEKGTPEPDPPEEPTDPDNPGCQCPDYEVATWEEVEAILNEVFGV